MWREITRKPVPYPPPPLGGLQPGCLPAGGLTEPGKGIPLGPVYWGEARPAPSHPARNRGVEGQLRPRGLGHKPNWTK